MNCLIASIGKIARWLFGGIGRIRHERWEFWMMRIGLVWLVFRALPSGFVFPTPNNPHGIARFVDLTILCREGVYPVLYWIMIAALAIYLTGFAVGPCLGYMLAFVVAANSLAFSQGYVAHSSQMEGLILLAQFAATVWVFFSCRVRKIERPEARRFRDDLMMDWTRQGILGSYVVAGITKLINSEGQWLNRADFFVLQVYKVQSENLYSYGDHPGAASSAFLSALNQWPQLAVIFLAGGLLLELFAFLGALNRPLGFVFGILIIGFHVMLGMLMYLPFYESRNYVMLFLINPAWWLWIGLKWIRGRRMMTGTLTLEH